MTDVYAMRRANGDWFALEEEGRLSVPVFNNTHDAFMARLRTVEMLLFSPIALDTRLLNEIVGGRSDVNFRMVNNPFAGVRRGSPLEHAQLASLMNGAAAPRGKKWL